MTNILCFDIGGTGVKAMLFDQSGNSLSERIRLPTPQPATPPAILQTLDEINGAISGRFQRIAVGFPGPVKRGVTLYAPNLSPLWKEFPLQKTIERKFGVKTRVSNDADLQGMGASRGKGLELTITLGTGVGSALTYEGGLVPNFELGHHQFRHGQTYEEQLGKIALDTVGKTRWNQRVKRMIRALAIAFNYDTLYIGGGNAKHVYHRLPPNVRLVTNNVGMSGGVRLWYPDVRIRQPYLKAA
jgi:polyphosphate glucokinase